MTAPAPLRDERVLARAAFTTAVASLLLALVFVPLHPRPHSFADHPRGLLTEVARHDVLWLVGHLGIAAVNSLGTAALVFIGLLLWQSRARVIAAVALASALATTGLVLAFVAVDGLATRESALAWAAAGSGDRAGAYDVAAATVRVADALEILGQMLLFGMTIALFGVAVLRSGLYPRGVGWAALATASFALLAGVLRASLGTELFTVTLFGVSGAVTSAWTVAAGYVALRRASAVEGTVRP